MPPSEASHQMPGLPGANAISCWSGWIVFPAASTVTSVNVRLFAAGSGSPAVVERTTPRAFERRPSSP